MTCGGYSSIASASNGTHGWNGYEKQVRVGYRVSKNYVGRVGHESVEVEVGLLPI